MQNNQDGDPDSSFFRSNQSIRSASGSITGRRLAVGLGDAERERQYLPLLADSGEFTVVERSLAADQLLTCLREHRADAALIAFDLHRLNSSMLADLVRTHVPLVLLTAASDRRSWESFPGVVLPLEADPAAVRQSLLSAIRGERTAAPRLQDKPAETPNENSAASTNATPPLALSTLAVLSGHGSPGRTTVALNLAVALGAVAPTVILDADLSESSLAPYLDVDPTRNLYMLAHAQRAFGNLASGE
ncbi:MAG: hypothetical protein NTZ05_17640 [Chloroflexi bacterium]|nr:hypothetical protein [Chloroflexota bacterium]